MQIRVYMDSLANNAVAGAATVSTGPTSVINSCNLIAKVTRLQSADVANRILSQCDQNIINLMNFDLVHFQSMLVLLKHLSY